MQNLKQGQPKIPNGDKSDSYCVINNAGNREKRRNNIRSDFVDDCGTWDTNTGKTVIFYMTMTNEGHLKSVSLKKGLFCTERRIKRVEKHHRSGNLWRINLQMKL